MRLKKDLPHDSEDLIQAGMVGLLRASRGYDPRRGSFPPYARACIESSIRDFASSDRPFGPAQPEHGAIRPVQGKLPEGLSADTVLLLEQNVDAHRIIALGLSALTRNEYALVQLLYRSGQSTAESAHELGIKAAAGRQLKSRALRKLRKAVKLEPAA